LSPLVRRSRIKGRLILGWRIIPPERAGWHRAKACEGGNSIILRISDKRFFLDAFASVLHLVFRARFVVRIGSDEF
jgi:hypothetical protein